jgi:hypothetical protein
MALGGSVLLLRIAGAEAFYGAGRSPKDGEFLSRGSFRMGQQQDFFVEKTELKWNEEAGQQVRLTRSLHPGTMIFVRMLLPYLAERASSVAYRAEQVSLTPRGEYEFRLERVKTKRERGVV